MSGITGISGSNANLLSLLPQPESDSSDPSLLNSLVASGPQTAGQDSGTSTTTTETGTGSSSGLQDEIQSAVTAALEGAEQSGGSDLKTVVYNALVQVLQNNGIDPKTLQPTGSSAASGSPSTLDSSTSAILAQVLTALSSASTASDPLAQLTSSQDDTGSSDLTSLLSTPQNNTGSSDSLSQFLALEDDSQGSTDLSSLLSAAGSAGQNTADLFSSQNNNQNLLGFLYDSGQ